MNWCQVSGVVSGLRLAVRQRPSEANQAEYECSDDRRKEGYLRLKLTISSQFRVGCGEGESSLIV